MVLTRAQEQRLSRLEEMCAERSKMMKQLADMVEAFSRSTAGKIEFPKSIDKMASQLQLQEELQSSNVLLEEKSKPEAQEENPKLENHEGWEQMVTVEVESDVEKGQEVQSMEKICTAHQVFDKMSLGVQSKRRQIKRHKSWRFKFKQRKQQRGKPRIAHKLIYKGILMIDSEDHLASSMVKEIGIEISSDRGLSNSIGCELETGETVSDEYRVPSDLLLLSGKDSLAVSAIGSKLEADLSNQERNRLCTKNKENEVEVDVWIQEQVENHSKDSVPEASWVPHMCLLLKHQVSTSHLAFSHRSSIGSLDVYDDWPSAIVRTRQSQSNFVLEYAAINAYQVCDSMSLGTKLLTNGRRKTFLKTWRFKFKHRVAPRDSKPGFEVKMKKNQELLDTSQKMQTRLVYHEEKKRLRHVGDDVKKGKNSFLGDVKVILASSMEELHLLQDVFEMVKELLLKTSLVIQSLVIQQVMRSKKFKFLKRWMFKYKTPHLDTKVFETSDQCTRKRVFVCADRLTQNNQPTLRSLMNAKQSCISLRTNRVWDPGGFQGFLVSVEVHCCC